MTQKDRRLLIVLVAALIALVLKLTVFGEPSAAPSIASANDIPLAEQRLMLVRRTVAGLPVSEALLKQADADLADRQRGLIQAQTAAQAQARLLEIATQLGKTEQIDVRGGEFGTPKLLGQGKGEYGLVYVTVSFDCHIDQLVSFLADLTRVPELVAPSEERISSGNAKEKLMTVRMVLAGAVDRKLVPEKKGLTGF